MQDGLFISYMKICIFAASSSMIDKAYFSDAAEMGSLLGREGHEIVYGAGGIGLMNELANAAMKEGARVTGVIPEFMEKNGWGHAGIDETIVTKDMSSRKSTIFRISDAIITLPGGIGTLEELSEAITLKQLGLFKGALVILNTNNFYNRFLDFLDHAVASGFMRDEHKRIWSVAANPAEAVQQLNDYTTWNENPQKIARI
jgi:uncharacterized protein (TIGR00730 family)